MRKKLLNRVEGIAILVMFIALVYFVLIPPATAVLLSPGTPSPTSTTTGNTVTFSNVNLTIRGYEKIPVNNLTFTIYNNANDNTVAYVKFYINGTEISDSPSGKFTVSNTTAIGSGWNQYGYQNGTDEETGQNYNFGYGYGYGYGGEEGYTDISFLYDIVYTTHTTGTFYAKLSVNSTSHTYVSSQSITFTISAPSTSDGGGTVTPPVEDEDEEEQGIKVSDTTINNINDQYDTDINIAFYANDTDADGTVDTFTDPNEVLFIIHETTINNNISFLLSTIDNHTAEFLWDSEADSVTHVTHNIGNIIDTEIDEIEKNQDHWGSDHCFDADAVPGVIFASHGLSSISNPSFSDIPFLTIGKDIKKQADADIPSYSDEDQEVIEERLKELGYL